MKHSPIFALCLAGAAAVVATGCGGSTLPEGETGTVSGTVTYNGQPVPQGSTVVFVRKDKGYVANAVTDAAGKYSLTMRDGSKILVGTYSVGVTPPTPTTPALSDEEYNRLSAEGKLPEPPKSPFPEKFHSPETSGLTFEVNAGPNTIDIPLAE